MCVHAGAIGGVPAETARVAKAAYRRGTAYLRLRDALGTRYTDADFAPLYPATGQPALPPWRVALVSVLQAVEGLSDRQAAEMVCGRLDWKYLLGLELTDPGFDFSVLSEFRRRILAGQAEAQVLDQVLTRVAAAGLFAPGGRQRTDSTAVLGAIRVLNRLEGVRETLLQALNHVATVAADGVQGWAPAAWYEDYSARTVRLPKEPAERLALAEAIGRDGQMLLDQVADPAAPHGLAALPAVGMLRQVWAQQYTPDAAGVRHWRAEADLPPAAVLVASPHDPAAQARNARRPGWATRCI